MKHVNYLLVVILILVGQCSKQISTEKLLLDSKKVIYKRMMITEKSLENMQFPMLADNITGEWISYDTPKWTGGFWVGMLWLAYEDTKSMTDFNLAKKWNNQILGFEQENDHDRGFVYFYSSVRAWQNTGDSLYFYSAMKAADKLVELYQPHSGIIPQNTKDKTNVIIDTMMNLQLLIWAYEQTNNDVYKNIAISHADKTLKDFFRSDGSTFQSVHYDTLSGEVLKKHTHQGYSDDSCWSRGQSWALYGFLKMYEATKNENYLVAAENAGQYIIEKLGYKNTPFYDYNDPGKYYDSSAGSIAASAFVELSQIIEDENKAKYYRDYSETLTKNLILKHLTPFNKVAGKPGIFQNGCYQHFKVADSETIWGDYYLLETLQKLQTGENQ